MTMRRGISFVHGDIMKIPMFAAVCLLSLTPASGEPCRLNLNSISQTSGAPGEIFEMHGEWGQRTDNKSAAINKGGSNNLEVISWSDRVLEVRVPEHLANGVYRVGVYCVSDGTTYSSGWKDFTVASRQSAETGSSLRDKAQSYWIQRRVRESHEAYKEALAAFRREKRIAGQAFSHYGLALTYGSLGDENAAEHAYEESALLYKQAMKQADIDGNHTELAKLEREYSNILYGLFRKAMRARQYDEARLVNEERLAIYTRSRDIAGQAVCHQGLGEVAEKQGRRAEAAAFFGQCAEEYREARNPYGVKACSESAARLGGAPSRASVENVVRTEPPAARNSEGSMRRIYPPPSTPYVSPAPSPAPSDDDSSEPAEEKEPDEAVLLAGMLKRTREGLQSLRATLSAYRMEQGRLPDSLADLLKEKKYIDTLPMLELPDHPRGRNFKLYPFYDQSPDKPSGLLDSGGWGYDSTAGTLFIDCIHKPVKGSDPYHAW